jgi:cell division septation protein DedD
MRGKSEGEVEVMLSDRQLILLFLVGVVLLAAFFGMGFLVGKRWATPASGGSAAAERRPAESLTKMAETLQKPKPAPPADTQRQETAPAAVPERESAAPAPAPAAKQPSSGALDVIEPARGSVYLQVSAQDLANARILVDSLQQFGFQSIIAPGPTRDVFRVLVGPLQGTEQLAKTRERLKAAGFDSIVRKY